MRSFRLIGKYSYPHHRVLTMEKPKKSVYKFYSPARSCMQTLLHNIPAHRPCRREKCLCLGAFAPHRRGSRSAKYRPKFPAFGAFCPRTAFPVQALPGQVSPVQEKPAQINNETNKILKEQIRILSYPQNIKTDFSAVILQRYIQLNTSEYNLRLHTAAIMRYNFICPLRQKTSFMTFSVR